MAAALIVLAVVVFFVLLFAISAIKVAREYERGIVFRLGRLLPAPKGPGLFLLIPVVDRMVRVDLRTITLNIPPQEVITKDNVPVRVNAVAYFRSVKAEAERERRAKVINAEGEYQASERLKDAAKVIEAHPIALQLRYLQTLLELGSSQSTTIAFPVPIEMLKAFQALGDK